MKFLLAAGPLIELKIFLCLRHSYTKILSVIPIDLAVRDSYIIIS